MRVEHQISLSPFTTFRVEARAKRLVRLESREDLEALRTVREKDEPLLIIGAGSNILFTKDFDGLVALNRITGVEELPRGDAGEYRFRAGSGENWSPLVCRMTESGHPGLENLVLIPGSVGGAAVQNIGAYGIEAAERIEAVEIFDLDSGEFRTLSTEACDFGYRSSVFKSEEGKNWVIVSVTFRLPNEKDWTPVTGYKGLSTALEGKEVTPRSVLAAVEALRRAKLPDPKEFGNAGSFFKNPVVPELQARALLEDYPQLVAYPLGGRRTKLAAGWLIDAAGFRGRVLGNAAVWDRQALVLVNRGGATGKEVKALCDEVIHAVNAKFGIELTPEVEIL